MYLAYDCKVERIGLEAVDKHIKALKATLYPDCAIIANDVLRKTCCEAKIESAAGRDFCLNQIVHATNKFDSCRAEPLVLETVYSCCDTLGGTNNYLGFDCKVDVLGQDAVLEYTRS